MIHNDAETKAVLRSQWQLELFSDTNIILISLCGEMDGVVSNIESCSVWFCVVVWGVRAYFLRQSNPVAVPNFVRAEIVRPDSEGFCCMISKIFFKKP